MQELLYQSTKSKIWKSQIENGEYVIIKVLDTDYPSQESLSQLKIEYDITQSFQSDNIRKAVKYGDFNGRPSIWLEYIEGETLKKHLEQEEGISLTKFFEIALAITNTLLEIHKQNIIHRDINPNNILINGQGQPVLIDFGIASRFNLKENHFLDTGHLAGTLIYISPEQTGRMNRIVDQRSDLYSLGITFYEMLTKKVPFYSQDIAELVHLHIAQVPTSPHEIKLNIPISLSDIVMKLLEKNAENRYNSAYGLYKDLQKAQKLFLENNLEEYFELGTEDFSSKFHISQQLYGREKENEVLLAQFKKINLYSSKEILLVGGYSGVGKTSLIHEIHKPITEEKGFFIEGKFDQYQKNVPYSAWIQAFEMFTNALLSSDAATLLQWKKTILEFVGTNGKVLIDVIPHLELIIGSQPEVSELGSIEAQNRFIYIFRQFLKAVTAFEKPLVIFIDDFQWADLPSLNLLQAIATAEDIGKLLIIGAYRNNEVSSSHPFIETVGSIKKDTTLKIDEIILQNLQIADVTAIIQDTIKGKETENIAELAALVYQKTNGNAFFVNQFLKTLYTENLIAFDYQNNCWTWDIKKIKRQNITDNVVELMASKIQKLNEKTQNILKKVACVGNKFNFTMLELLGVDSNVVENILEEALIEGIIIRIKTGSYGFAHDRIQQAAYSLIPEQEKKEFHLEIGHLLWEDYKNTEHNSTTVFDVVNQFNRAVNLIAEDFKLELANLNMKAGKAAKTANAYAAAREYLQLATQLFEKNLWETQYDIAVELFSELAEVEYLNGAFEASQELVEHILQNVKTDIEKAEIYNMLIIQNTLSSRFNVAIELGAKGLALMNENLVTNNSMEVLQAEIGNMMGKINGRDVLSLINEPVMQEPTKIVATKLLVNLIPTAYLSGQMPLYALISAKIINIGLQYGHSKESSHGYSNYGGVVAAMMGEYQLAYQFGQLAMQLTEKFDNMYLRCKDSMLFGNFMSPWVRHIKETEAINLEGFKLGLETGELQYPGYIAMFQVMSPWYSSEILDNVLDNANKYLDFTSKTKHQWVYDGIFALKMGVCNLLGISHSPESFSFDEIDETKEFKEWVERTSFNAASFYHILKAETYYLYGNSALALQHLKQAEPFMPAIAGMIITSSYNFYHSLVLADLYGKQVMADEEIIAQITQNQLQMKKWADNCTQNFLHKYYLVEAQLAKIQGNIWESISLHKKSIDEARENKFIQNEAIAQELLAKLWKTQKQDEYAALHIERAYNAYNVWGAFHKTNLLKKEYVSLQQNNKGTYETEILKTVNVSQMTSLTTMGSSSSLSIDINSILKASQTISKEVVLEELLQKMIYILAENAGATYACLLLPKKDEWSIEAVYKNSQTHILENISIQGNAPQTVMNYVLRVGKTVLLGNAFQQGNFVEDAYIKANKTKSVLAMPLLKGKKIQAILYLENNLNEEVFTNNRIETLTLLSSQVLISIENATLYASLEDKVAERTKQLAEKNADITASIMYAKRIQEALLPQKILLQETLKDYFILFKPRDIVSGDFYWCAYISEINKTILAAVDCTGHGVPGAFMSMIGESLLQKVVFDMRIYEADAILEEMHKGINRILKQDETQNQDGMDLALIVIDRVNKQVEFSGAKSSLVYIQNDTLHEIKGNKHAIGGKQRGNILDFTKHIVDISTTTNLYLFSDGYKDQFGGKLNRKFGSNQFTDLLHQIHKEDSSIQHNILDKTITEWAETTHQKQIDDILVIGVRILE
jgi:histidine kinase